MGSNLDEMISVMDHKLNIIIQEMNRYKKCGLMDNSKISEKVTQSTNKMEVDFKYKVEQLEERIY